MFRKRHVQIGPVSVTMTRGDALLLYVKDRHVHEALESRASRTSDVHAISSPLIAARPAIGDCRCTGPSCGHASTSSAATIPTVKKVSDITYCSSVIE